MAFIWFAIDEPHLFSMIMEAQTQPTSYKDYIDTYIGFKEESISAITDTFGLQEEDAEMLYYQLILVALGLALTCTGGKSPITIPQVSEILGKNASVRIGSLHFGTSGEVEERLGEMAIAGRVLIEIVLVVFLS